VVHRPDLVVAGSIRAGDCWAVAANSNEVLGWCGGAISGVHMVRLWWCWVHYGGGREKRAARLRRG